MKNLVASVMAVQCLGFKGPNRMNRVVSSALGNPVTAIQTIYRDGDVRLQCPYYSEGLCNASNETRRKIACPYAVKKR